MADDHTTSPELSNAQLELMAEVAKRDDWHYHFVGSDIRLLIGEVQRFRASQPQSPSTSQPCFHEYEGSDQTGWSCHLCGDYRELQHEANSSPSTSLSDEMEHLRAIIVAVPISSMVGRVVAGRKVRNYNEAKALLEHAAMKSKEQSNAG